MTINKWFKQKWSASNLRLKQLKFQIKRRSLDQGYKLVCIKTEKITLYIKSFDNQI